MRSAWVDVLAPKVAIANVGRMFCIAGPPGVDWSGWDYTHNHRDIVEFKRYKCMFLNANPWNGSQNIVDLYFYY